MTQFHHLLTFVNYGTVNYVTLCYVITLMNCPLIHFNSLCLPIHWNVLLMCTCTKLSSIQSSFWGYLPMIEISDFCKLWMHVLKSSCLKCFAWMYVKMCVSDVSYIIFYATVPEFTVLLCNGNVIHKLVT